ncbi:MAG: DNA repair protein RecO [Bacteroidales bacterium]|nr:DNA repair protein RecO [Bacteroidales bacterium]
MTHEQVIVLHTFRYGESGHIVQVLSREHGLLSCMVKGRRRSPLPPVLMQPLSLVEVVMDVRPNRQFQFLRESAPLALYDGIAGNPAKNAMALFLCEILCRALRESPADVRLFDFVADSVAVLNRVERGVANFHLVFLIKMTYFLGFFPNLSDFHADVLFDMENSSFVDVQTNVHTLDVAQTEVFAQLMRMDYANMYLFALSGAQRSDILDKILTYYRLHLPDFGEVKSFEVLRQLFA